jgi:hypothetical protein
MSLYRRLPQNDLVVRLQHKIMIELRVRCIQASRAVQSPRGGWVGNSNGDDVAGHIDGTALTLKVFAIKTDEV